MKLDDAYANGAHIPGAEDFPPRWADLAAGFRADLGRRAHLGISYGPGPRQAYDFFEPRGDSKGTVVFVHGGYWRAFDRSYWSHLAAGPLARGWSVAMPSYDLCPDVRIHQITEQVASALKAIAAHANGQISLTGHSAGGHLVARMLDPLVCAGSVGVSLHAVVPISPLSDLRPLLETSINDDLHLDMAEAEAESPLFMQSRNPAPITVWVGADERPAFLDQARWLADCWGSELVIAPDRHHFNVIDDLAEPDSDMVRRLTA